MDLGDDPDGDARLGRGKRGALAGETGSDDEDVVARHAAREIRERRRIKKVIWSIGATSFGQASMQLKQCVQS